MTYVELIVVLSIFAVMTSIVLFNYNKYQDSVDIKVLANDIASKIVEAQKAATSGNLPGEAQLQYFQVNGITAADWKPSYGIYFNTDGSIDIADNISYNKKFIYFANLDNSADNFGTYNGDPSEVLDTKKITTNDYISDLTTSGCSLSTGAESTGGIGSIGGIKGLNIMNIAFTRPGSNAVINGDTACTSAQITISSASDSSIKSCIQIYSSGRIQIGDCQNL